MICAARGVRKDDHSGKGVAERAVLEYYAAMRGRILYAMRLAILALYCAYTVSPIYLSAMAGAKDTLVSCGDPSQKVTVGIVWLRVLVSSLCGDDEEAPAVAAREVRGHDSENDFILIKKKRAVLREEPRLSPPLAKAVDVPVPPAAPLLAAFARETRWPRCFRQENISLYAHAGLSPPRSS